MPLHRHREASHGTYEFYAWRAELTQRLILGGRCNWIGVEGDWPDCWRINQWVRGRGDETLDARTVLAGFERWPTWMWVNTDVADFLDWLHEHNSHFPHPNTWASTASTSTRCGTPWLERSPGSRNDRQQTCRQHFAHGGVSNPSASPEQYAWITRVVPETCEAEVVDLLAKVRRHAGADGEDTLDALQNAIIAAGAESYYRAMVRTDRMSWNIRDQHMADTINRLSDHAGTGSRRVLWEHNSHTGDARATSMQAQGLPYDVLHSDAVVDFGTDRDTPWLTAQAGHRAIGVVDDPEQETDGEAPSGRVPPLAATTSAIAMQFVGDAICLDCPVATRVATIRRLRSPESGPKASEKQRIRTLANSKEDAASCDVLLGALRERRGSRRLARPRTRGKMCRSNTHPAPKACVSSSASRP